MRKEKCVHAAKIRSPVPVCECVCVRLPFCHASTMHRWRDSVREDIVYLSCRLAGILFLINSLFSLLGPPFLWVLDYL